MQERWEMTPSGGCSLAVGRPHNPISSRVPALHPLCDPPYPIQPIFLQA
jgi:hypothetical protein